MARNYKKEAKQWYDLYCLLKERNDNVEYQHEKLQEAVSDFYIGIPYSETFGPLGIRQGYKDLHARGKKLWDFYLELYKLKAPKKCQCK